MISLSEAQALIFGFSKSFGDEIVTLDQVYGRVLAEDVFADRNYPPFHRAAMDGFAIRYQDFIEDRIGHFNILHEIHAGDDIDVQAVSNRDCVKIMTGAATPENFDTIIRVEDSKILGNGKVSFLVESIRKGQNISRSGEDALKADVVLTKGNWIQSSEMGLLAAIGKEYVRVEKLPKIALFSTGNEVRPVGHDVLPFQIRDSNRYTLGSLLKNYHIETCFTGLLADDKNEIRSGLESVESADILILTGGVSAGDADYIPALLKESGYREIFHKVKIKPGKPIWFGVKGNQTVFALPGNPMSCQVGFKLFVEPFIRKCFGLNPYSIFKFPLSQDRKKRVQLDEFFPVKIIDDQIVEVKTNGSGDIRTGLGSQGLARHPMEGTDMTKGDKLDFIFW